nr:hypothetical protein [Tanacetum cinerariifolium]
QAQVVLVLTHQIASRIVEPLQATGGVGGSDQLAVAVVGKGFALRLLTKGGVAFGEATHGVEAQANGALAVDGLGQATCFRIATFGIAAKTLFSLIRVLGQHQLAKFVGIFGFVSGGVGEADHLSAFVVLPTAGFSRTVHILQQLPGVVVRQGLSVAVGVLDRRRKPERVVGVFGVIHHAVISAGVFGQVAQAVIAVAVGRAVGMDVANDVLGVVPKEPLRAPVGVANAVGVTEAVVKVLGLMAEGIGDDGEADVFVPRKARIKAAVVRPFAHSLGIGARALPLQVHAAMGAVGVAGNQMVFVLIAPRRTVLVLSQSQVARIIIFVRT